MSRVVSVITILSHRRCFLYSASNCNRLSGKLPVTPSGCNTTRDLFALTPIKSTVYSISLVGMTRSRDGCAVTHFCAVDHCKISRRPPVLPLATLLLKNMVGHMQRTYRLRALTGREQMYRLLYAFGALSSLMLRIILQCIMLVSLPHTGMLSQQCQTLYHLGGLAPVSTVVALVAAY